SAHPGAFRMYFTCNHDWNSWEGTAVDRFGRSWEAATVLTFTVPGMPLIYSGQEAGLDKRLEFFEKDPIAWRDHPAAALYAKLCALKRSEPALWHGPDGGTMEFLRTRANDRVVAFQRTKGDSEVVVIANLSPEAAKLGDLGLDLNAAYVNLEKQSI